MFLFNAANQARGRSRHLPEGSPTRPVAPRMRAAASRVEAEQMEQSGKRGCAAGEIEENLKIRSRELAAAMGWGSLRRVVCIAAKDEREFEN
nr:hypothetical protein Iba_chr04dCG5240 [Ipomoea batatas]